MKSPPDTLTLDPPRRIVMPDAPGKILVLRREVTVAEFAAVAGISPRRVQSLCDEGAIQFRRQNPSNERSHYRIPFDELRRFVAL